VKLRHGHAILVLSLVLLVIGLVIVFSASHEFARMRTGSPLFFLRRQMVRAVFGVIGLLIASEIDFRNWRKHAGKFLLVTAGGLVIVFFFHAIRGARGWVTVLGQTVQPVEFARLALVCYLAAEIARLGPKLQSLRQGLLPLAAVVGGVLALVVLQPDYGSAMAISLICATMLFVGGVRLRHLGLAGVVLVVGVSLLAWQKPHVRERIFGFVHPDAHAAGEAYQSLQSVLSIGAGGPFGRGLGQGLAKYGYLPDAHTDFIFSVMGEELGFVGCAVVLGLFLMLVGRAIQVARAHEDPFARLLAVGIGMSLFWFVAVNVLVATRLFPVTGLPLPLISYGGSSLVTHLVALGILRNLARQTEGELRPHTRWPLRHQHAVEAVL
jgi:cell division protein FtsW